MAAVSTGLEIFRYKSGDFYTVGALNTNLWKYMDMVRLYPFFAFWTLAALFQFLSLFNVAVDINLYIWMLGHELNALIGLIYYVVMYYLYETNYAACSAAGGTGDECDMEAMVRKETAKVVSMAAMNDFLTIRDHAAWMEGQFRKLSPEKQAEFQAFLETAVNQGDAKVGADDVEVEFDDVAAEFTLNNFFKFVHF